MNILDRQFQDVYSLLASPLGLAVIMLLMAATVSAVFSTRVRWVVLVILLLSTTFTQPTFSLTTLANGVSDYRPLIFPFETMRAQTRAISSAMVCILLLPSLLTPAGWRKTLVPAGVAAFLLFQLWFSVMEITVDPEFKLFLSLPIFIATFIVVGVGVNKMLQTRRDVMALLWAMVAAIALMSIAISLQLLLGDPKAMFVNSRFMGMTANPQFLAAIIAPGFIIVLAVLMERGVAKLLKVGLGLLAAALLVFLFWTGSRTGALMVAVGVLLFFRLRLGRMMLAACITAVCVFAVLQLFGNEGSDQSGRYINMTDTRSYVWERQWKIFADSPFLGSVAEGSGTAEGGGENSYLTVAASYGIVGLLPLVAMMSIMAWDLLRTWRVREVLPEYGSLIDMIVALYAMTVVGAWFEAYLLGQFNLIVLIWFISSAIAAWLRDLAAVESQAYLGVNWETHSGAVALFPHDLA